MQLISDFCINQLAYLSLLPLILFNFNLLLKNVFVIAIHIHIKLYEKQLAILILKYARVIYVCILFIYLFIGPNELCTHLSLTLLNNLNMHECFHSLIFLFVLFFCSFDLPSRSKVHLPRILSTGAGCQLQRMDW